MKAIRMHAKGGPELLRYEDAPEPAVEPGDALVRVMASAITSTELTWDETYHACDGSPRIPTIIGHEFSGVVQSVAPGVTVVRPGEEVYGLCSFCRNGSAAEFVAVEAGGLAPKPKSLDHLKAASVPLAALTAWQAFFEQASLGSGQRVLIHSAAGGVGIFAVQLAAWKGAHVIATASARNHEFLRELGADELIDYNKEQFEDRVSDVDIVLDTMGGETREHSWGVLKRGGTIISIQSPPPAGKAEARGVRGVFFIVEPNRLQLMEIGNMIDTGKLKTHLDLVLPLEQARQAFEHALKGHARGKIVLRVKADAAVDALGERK